MMIRKGGKMKNFIKRMVFLGTCFLMSMVGICFGAADVPAIRDAKDPAEKARVQGLVEKAQKEGKLVWTGIMIEPKHAKFILEGFKDYYGLKALKTEYTYGQSAQVIAQVEQLVKANRATPDIVWQPAWSWYIDLMKRGLIVRYESPYYKDYTISNAAGNSKPGYWVSDAYTFHPMWNAGAMVKAGFKDFNPKSWRDFVDPKFGKYTSIGNIAKSTSYTAVSIGLRKALGDKWFKKIAAMKPAAFIKSAQGRDWCASGEYPIDLLSHAKNAEAAKKTGADIKLLYPKEGVTLLPFAPIILKGGVNQNAARLFIDYVRSVPGTNRVAASEVGILFGRPGVKMPPDEYLPPAETIKSIPMDWDKEDTTEFARHFHAWLIDIGLSY